MKKNYDLFGALSVMICLVCLAIDMIGVDFATAALYRLG